MNLNDPKTIFAVRTFLKDLHHTDWENQWIAVRVQEPHRYHNDQPYYVAGQLDISDGSHTASFHVDFKSKDEADKILESLKILSNTLVVLIDKIEESGDKLSQLNAGHRI